MSINALTNAAVSRRSDFAPANSVPQNLTDIAIAAGAPPQPVPLAGVQPAGGSQVAPSDGPNTMLQALTTYIPTEILALYVSAVATLGSITNAEGHSVPGCAW